MAVLAEDMHGHVRSSNVGYDGLHGGFGYTDPVRHKHLQSILLSSHNQSVEQYAHRCLPAVT